MGNWIFPGEYYLSLLGFLGSLVACVIIATLGAVIFLANEEYRKGKRAGENRNLVYYAKGVLIDFYCMRLERKKKKSPLKSKS